ncbi:AAA family ATPase [Psychrobacter sp. W2-37-MNA-CIBAN-0211]|uniref:AAA family ATPase n=1 Tax=Psychrobacter sp. W2-37-MNA-CIBAN-0211 TaxID=3140443 RepID=UPI003329B852
MTDLKNKIITLQEHLNHGLVGRKDEVKAALLTLLAGENLLLVGPPGTAKSLLARRVAGCLQSIDNNSDNPIYFEYLLTKFSTPEEVFGPLSISELKKDNFKRNTTGYLPTVQIAFLDEIFKASSSILNALLTILNERQYHNGATLSAVPLQALIAASNELPTGQEELNALYDRFLIRKFVDYVKPDDIAFLFELSDDDDGDIENISMEEIKELTKRSDDVIVPAQIVRIVQDIWLKHREIFSEDRRESLSDRRLVKLIKLLRISAASNGRHEVDLSDVVLFKDSLWNHPENKEAVFDLIFDVLRKNSCTVEVMPNDSSTKDSQKKIEKPQNTERDITAESRLIKGCKGSGTKNNPILISNYEELLDLERKDVGQQGYYFEQTTDIDCTEINTWPNINFIGTYDGGGHTIKYKKGKNKSTTVDGVIGSLIGSQMLYGYRASKYEASKIEYLFESVQSNSNLVNINLEDLCLCQDITDSNIKNCNMVIKPSTIIGDKRNLEISYLIRDVKKSKITNCQTSSALAHKVSDSIINQCTSTSSILTHTVTDSLIQLSVAELSIALYLKKSIVKQCQSSGVLVGKSAVDSYIENCVVLLKNIDGNHLYSYSSQYNLPNKLFGVRSDEIKNKSCYANDRSNVGLVVSHLESSKVLNTLVTAYDESIDIVMTTDITWSGIAFGCFDSEIKGCVLGSYKILKHSNVGVSVERANRIVGYAEQSTLENNLAADIHRSIKSKTGDNGVTIDRARLTKNYFENTLHWNFDSIWQWDEGNNIPVLQMQAGDLVASTHLVQKVDTEDLLTRQISQNIWL